MFPVRHGPLAFLALSLGVAACSPPVAVRSLQSPTADIAAFHTFQVLPAPHRRASAPALAPEDPMLENSIINQQLRQDLQRAFESRGYQSSAGSPDFVVAYYVGTKAKFDTTYWNPGPWRYTYWGYRNRYAWPFYDWAPAVAQVREYTQGTVLVDVIDPRTHQLAWRGQGTANVSSEPKEYAGELARTVDDIVRRFPTMGSASSN